MYLSMWRVPVAVDVPLYDLPVIDSRVARLSCVGEDNSRSEFIWIDTDRSPSDSCWTHFNRCDTTKYRWMIVLPAGWNTDDLRLQISCESYQ